MGLYLLQKIHWSRTCFALLLLAGLLTGCGRLSPQQRGSIPPDHQAFTDLLQKHVDSIGLVNYVGFLEDSLVLKNYLHQLEINVPDPTNWSDEAQLAYWINAYNAYTILLVIRHYPVASIREIGGSPQVPFVNTPWDIPFIRLAGEQLDLNNIEHNILRKLWNEPRVHFAINCASLSCPQLRNEAYTASQLDAQLTDQAIQFFRDPNKNRIYPNQISLSGIMRWYSRDFTRDRSMIAFINQYAAVQISDDAALDYLEYDWTLNQQK